MILDENLEEQESDVPHLSDQDIFTKIWLYPRSVFRFIVAKNYNKHVVLLLILAGIANSFDRASEKGYWDEQDPLTVIALALVLGAAFGWISYYLYSALVSVSGKWLGGKSSTKEILNVLAYASIPNGVALIIIFANLMIFGSNVYTVSFDETMLLMPMRILYYSLILIIGVLGIYTLVLSVIGVAERQNFSTGRSIANLILAVLVLIIPLLLIVLLITS
mgnify:CR=1 FL=1